MTNCLAKLEWSTDLSKTSARRVARDQHGWRVDKLNRDVCSAHSKLKGARR